MSILERLTSLFAPDDCLGCGREGSLLCTACRPSLPAPIGRCFGCQRKISDVACGDCLRTSGLDSLQAATSYQGIAKLLVACLKFRGNQSAARSMATAMLPHIPTPTPGALLIHMPATTTHVRERGYDQSALLVRQLARTTGLPRRAVLRRSGSHHQLGADRAQRLTQLSQALSVANPANVRGRHIILVDDVLTTGSSLTAAAYVLRMAGAQHIDGIVFAQALSI